MAVKKKYNQKVDKSFVPIKDIVTTRKISHDEAYNYFTKGEEVVNLKNKMKIQLRYNTPYPERSIYRWRLLKDGVEIALIDDVLFHIPTYTTEDEVEVLGKKVKKCHITCDATQVIIRIDEENDTIVAEIK